MIYLAAWGILIFILIVVGMIIIMLIIVLAVSRGHSWRRREMSRIARSRRRLSIEKSREDKSSEQLLNFIAKSDVEVLRCYSCNDVFDPAENKCNKCGASRPSCIICYQDLKPSEKKEVTQLPCCDVYVHEEHILSWLKESRKCPNCRKDLSEWFNQLKA